MTDDINAVKAHVEALEKKVNWAMDRIAELEDDKEQLQSRVGELEELVDPDPGSVDYEQLTRPQKVQQIRSKLAQVAKNNGGKAALEYGDVNTLFDGYPSAGHCYDLMERAGEIDGFKYESPAGKNNRVRVDLEAVNEDAVFHAVNNSKAAKGVAN